jgi:hypothetical protein
MGRPACGEHALPENEIGVFTLAEANLYVHFASDCALSHGLLGWPLGRGDEVDGDCSPASGD